MPTPMDPTSTGFLFAENRSQPMHVGGLQLFQQAGGRRAQLRQGHVRGDADPRPAGAAVPQAADAVGVHGGPVVLDRGRPVRHRVPRPAQRPAEARPDPRAARAVRAAAQHPARPGAAAVGDPLHRGPARRPGRDVLQDAPRPDRRGLLDAADAERAVTDPDGRDMAPTWSVEHDRGRPRAASRGRRSTTPACRWRPARGAGDRRRGGRAARGAGQDALARRAQRDLRAVALRPAHDHQQADHRLAPVRRRRTGRSSGCRRSARPRGTTLNDVVLAMCSGAMRSYLDELGALPDTSLVAMVPVGLKAKSSQSASASGGNAVGAVMVKLGTDLADPADRLAGHPPLDGRPARRRSAR